MNYDKYKGHTPGPWAWKPRENGSPWPTMHNASSMDGQWLAMSGQPDSPTAALIADAPALLAENRKLRAALSELIAEHDVDVEAAWDQPSPERIPETGGMAYAKQLLGS